MPGAAATDLFPARQTDPELELLIRFALDCGLIANGYEPIALNGKRPAGDGWQIRDNTPQALAAERRLHPNATNTGLRTGRLSVIDIDLKDGRHAWKVRRLAAVALGISPLERVGSKGCALGYRNASPIGKITIVGTHPTRTVEKIEILGQGQQVAAYGTHPDTGKPYRWPFSDCGLNGEPLTLPLAELPEVTPEKLRDFARRAAELLTRLGFRDVTVTGPGLERASPRQPSAQAGVPIPPAMLDEWLSFIKPSEDRGEWWKIATAIEHDQLPLTEAQSAEQCHARQDAWSDGYLWRKRTGEDYRPAGYDPEDNLRQLGEKPNRDHDIAGLGTIYRLAVEGGYSGPPYAIPAAAEAFGACEAVRAAKAFRPGFETLRMSSITAHPVEWLWPNRFPAGKLSQLVGDGGLGKTTLALYIAARVTRGDAWPDGGRAPAAEVLIISSEDDPSDTLKPRLVALGADLDKIHYFNGTKLASGARGAWTLDDLTSLNGFLDEHPAVRLVIVDPVSALFPKGCDPYNNMDVRRILGPLCTLLAARKVTVLAINHLRKGSGSAAQRAIGSIGILNQCRATWLYSRDPDRPDDLKDPNRAEWRLLTLVKMNVTRDPGGLEISSHAGTVECDGQWHSVPLIEVHPEAIETTADEAAGEQSDEGAALKEAMTFLRDYMAGGDHPAANIRREAKEGGFCWRTVEKAKARLRIRSKRIGGVNGTWVWQWPHPQKDGE